MQDPGYELRKIYLPRTPVNKGKNKGRGFFLEPRPLFGTRYARAKLPRLRFGPNLTA
jgi:hypothetical protein